MVENCSGHLEGYFSIFIQLFIKPFDIDWWNLKKITIVHFLLTDPNAASAKYEYLASTLIDYIERCRELFSK